VKRIPKQDYTTEFKEQAVKRVDEVGSIARVAEELGRAEQTLRNGVKAAKAGKLNLAGAKQITAEQMELSR
jgi:transposase